MIKNDKIEAAAKEYASSILTDDCVEEGIAKRAFTAGALFMQKAAAEADYPFIREVIEHLKKRGYQGSAAETLLNDWCSELRDILGVG